MCLKYFVYEHSELEDITNWGLLGAKKSFKLCFDLIHVSPP